MRHPSTAGIFMKNKYSGNGLNMILPMALRHKKVIIKELKKMFDRIDFHVREPETGNFHIPAWAKEEHMEQSVSEKELWSYEKNKK